MTQIESEHASPDIVGTAFVQKSLNATRYSGHTDDPHEVAGIVHRLMPSGVRVLDIGCGTGSVSHIANRGKNNRFVGIEPDSVRANVARSSGLEVFCGYFESAFLEDNGVFDVVVMTDVLEHLVDPSKMLKLALDALGPGGCVILSVPNVAHWSIRAMLLFGRFDYTDVGLLDATHLRWFTKRSLSKLVCSTNLNVEVVAYTAGSTLALYQKLPFLLLPALWRRQLLRLLKSVWPSMFACQIIIKARRLAEEGPAHGVR